MLKEKIDSLLPILTAVAFIVLAIYLLTQDVSVVGPF